MLRLPLIFSHVYLVYDRCSVRPDQSGNDATNIIDDSENYYCKLIDDLKLFTEI